MRSFIILKKTELFYQQHNVMHTDFNNTGLLFNTNFNDTAWLLFGRHVFNKTHIYLNI